MLMDVITVLLTALLSLPVVDAQCSASSVSSSDLILAFQHTHGAPQTESYAHLLSGTLFPASWPCSGILNAFFLTGPTSTCAADCVVSLTPLVYSNGSIEDVVMARSEDFDLYPDYETLTNGGTTLYCAASMNSCGATIPLYGFVSYAYSDHYVNTSTQINDATYGYDSGGVPLCYAWTAPSDTSSIRSKYDVTSSTSGQCDVAAFFNAFADSSALTRTTSRTTPNASLSSTVSSSATTTLNSTATPSLTNFSSSTTLKSSTTSISTNPTTIGSSSTSSTSRTVHSTILNSVSAGTSITNTTSVAASTTSPTTSSTSTPTSPWTPTSTSIAASTATTNFTSTATRLWTPTSSIRWTLPSTPNNITWLPPPFITGSYPSSSSRRPRRNSTRRPAGWNNTGDDDGDDWDPIDDDDNGTGSSGRDRNWWWWWNPDRWWDSASGRDRYYDDYDYHYDTPKWRRVWRWVGLGIGVFFVVLAILLMACLICAVAKSKRRRQVDPYADIYGDGRAEPPPVAMGAMPTYPTPPTAKY